MKGVKTIMRLKRKLVFGSLLLFCIFILSISSAQAAEWKLAFETPQGMPSGWINQMIFHPTNPNTFYAVTEGAGFMVSEDEGKTWTPKNQGLNNAEGGTISGFQVRCIVLDPVKPETIYVGMAVFGVYKSTDSGNTWTDINGTLEDTYTRSLVIHPANLNMIYLGTDGGGIYRYDIQKDEWEESVNGLKNTYIRTIVMDPKNPKILYVATDGGVSKTIDGADNWTLISNGITSRTVFCLAMDPKNPKIFYAGTETGGLFKTIDGGENWGPVGGEIWMSKPIMDDSAPTTDDIPSTLIVTSVAVNPVNSSIVYAANPAGVFRSADAGNTWTQINTGLTNTIIKSLAVRNSKPVKVYVSTSNGKFFVYSEE
jgi:photosystem II stability/assembly factor-like uncharacterized protein